MTEAWDAFVWIVCSVGVGFLAIAVVIAVLAAIAIGVDTIMGLFRKPESGERESPFRSESFWQPEDE